jgi:hypothetical protein
MATNAKKRGGCPPRPPLARAVRHESDDAYERMSRQYGTPQCWVAFVLPDLDDVRESQLAQAARGTDCPGPVETEEGSCSTP